MKSKTKKKEAVVKFSEKTFQFIEKAAKQKRADWLDKNREEYEAVLLHPLQNLVRYAQAELNPLAPQYHFPVKGIARIKRSANRASETGSIYKDWISYSASRPRKSRFESNPNLYFGIDPLDEDGDRVLVAGGLYMPSSPQTRAIRHAISVDASAFKKLFASKSFSECFKGGFSKDRISSRVPRGYDEHQPQLEWLKLQGFFVWRAYSKKEFCSAEFPKLVTRDWRQILRLNDLLEQAIQGKIKKPDAHHPSEKQPSPLDDFSVVPRKLDF